MEHTILQQRAANWWRVESLTKKAFLNALASGLDCSARIAVDLIITPLLLAGVGDVLFGVWRIIYQFMGFAWASGGRSSQALKMVLASEQNVIDGERKRQYVGAAVMIWILVLPIGVILCVLSVVFLPSILTIPADLVLPARAALAISIANAILLSLADIPKAVLAGENLGYRRAGLSAFLVLVTGLLTAAAIKFDMGLPGVALAATVGTVLNAVMFVNVAKRYVHWFGIRMPSGTAVGWFGRKSVGFFLWKWINQFLLGGDVLLLGILGSPAMVTVYSLTKYAPNVLLRLTGFAVGGASAGFGELLGDRRFAKLRRARAELMSGTWLIATVSGVALLLWTPGFLQLWVGPGYDPGLEATLLIIILTAQLMLLRNDASLIDLTLDLRLKLMLGAASVVLTIAIVLLFAPSDLGLVTLCFALMVGRIPISIGYPQIVGKAIGIAPSEQILSSVRPFAATTMLLGVACVLRDSVVVSNWPSLCFNISATLLAASLAAASVGMSAAQRQGLVKRMRAVC